MRNNTLTRKQFDILTFLDRKGSNFNQREISEQVGMSLATVNRTIAALTDLGYLDGYTITGSGYGALEPYRVKRAVFLAAGFGHRLVPITLNTPRSLIRVKGVRLIDTLLDAVIAAGIEEITLSVAIWVSNSTSCCISTPPSGLSKIPFITNRSTSPLLSAPGICCKMPMCWRRTCCCEIPA